MFSYILLSSALFVISTQSENSAVTLLDLKNNISNRTDVDLLKKAKLPLETEGGTLLPNTADNISLPKSNFTNYLSLDEELDKRKEKSSVPRKGVDNLLAVDSEIPLQSNTSDSVTDSEKLKTDSKNSSIITAKSKDTTSTKNETLERKNQNLTEVHKKPVILSYEALTNMEKNIKNNQSKLPIAPSTKTMASNQIPSPNEDSIVKVYPLKANSHPGMVMPVVITILVVPMFAIVGYMALKRGQEAWKNRHYKRMDFLLDGMYND